MSGRNDVELQGVTLLGNQSTKYNYDYDADVLECFVNKHSGNEYFVNSIAPNSLAYVRKPDSLILHLSIYPMYGIIC